MGRRRTYGFSYSWRRALGVSAAKGRLSRSIGVLLTQSGGERKLGHPVGSYMGLGVVAIVLLIVSRL